MFVTRIRISNAFLKHAKQYQRIYQGVCKRHSSNLNQLVAVTEKDGVRNIIMNSPKTRNALSMEMMDSLLNGIQDAEDPSLRCIIISSNGPVYSSGHNLKDLAKADDSFHMDTFNKCAELMLAITKAPVPVIASVNGVAAAAGCQLVASCDIVIATSKSSFSTPGAAFGIFCSTPGIALSRSVGRKPAARMLLTGLPVSAQEALNIGLISKICEEHELDQELEKDVAAIKSKSRSVIHLGKRFFYEHVELDIRSAYRLGSQVMTNNLALADGQEGLRSFVEKRPPVWKNDFSGSGATEKSGKKTEAA